MTQDKIKIVHIITRLVKGGAQENVVLTARCLAERGFDVYLVSGPTSGPEGLISLEGIKDKVKLFTVPELIRGINPIKDLVALVKLYLFIKKNDFDIVHTHTSKAGMLGRLAAKLARTPVVIYTPHGHVFYGHFNFLNSRIFMLLEKLMTSLTDKVITLTEIGKREHIKFRIGKDDKFTVIPYGIEFDKFVNRQVDALDVRRELEISPNVPVVGIVARLVPVKGHRYLLDAFKIVLQECPDVRLMVVGDGILKERLMAYCGKNGIGHRVIFTGLRYDIPRLVSAFDVSILSSLYEGLGLVLLEAMAMKKPVIATDSGGIPEIVQDGREGYLVPPRDHVAMANRILKLVQNPGIAKTMGENGFRKVSAFFSVDDKIEKLENLYNELLEKKQS